MWSDAINACQGAQTSGGGGGGGDGGMLNAMGKAAGLGVELIVSNLVSPPMTPVEGAAEVLTVWPQEMRERFGSHLQSQDFRRRFKLAENCFKSKRKRDLSDSLKGDPGAKHS